MYFVVLTMGCVFHFVKIERNRYNDIYFFVYVFFSTEERRGSPKANKTPKLLDSVEKSYTDAESVGLLEK